MDDRDMQGMLEKASLLPERWYLVFRQTAPEPWPRRQLKEKRATDGSGKWRHVRWKHIGRSMRRSSMATAPP